MADFSKGSGNSTKGVEMIAVVRPGHVAYGQDKESGEKVAKAAYVEVMTNNSQYTKADIAAGKGQANPNLYSKTTNYVDKDGKQQTGYENGIRMSISQLETIEKAGGSKALTKEDGTKYIPFKADVMGLKETVKDKEGNPVKDENGKNKERLVGFMPNTKTVEPSELGNLTEKRLDKHFANTTAISDLAKERSEAAKASKDAKLQATASEKAPAEASAGKDKGMSIAD